MLAQAPPPLASEIEMLPCNTCAFFFFNIYLFLAALGLCYCARAFSRCSEWGLLFAAVRGLLIAVAFLVTDHGLQSTALVVVVHGLSCFAACGIFLDQGSNPCSLHWQMDS